MRLRYLFVAVAMTASLVSCFKDDTTLGTGAISEIMVDSISEVYNINQNDTLIITPYITQTNHPKEISYTWEMDLEHYSDSCCFVFIGKQFGSYNCRLIVENSDGKTFFPFVVHVNTIYEEGLTILSKDTNGKAMLSFMLTPPDGNPIGFMKGDQFSINNEEPFADNPTDMLQSDGRLIIACQGSNDGSIPATIYSLNEKTFFLENMASAPSFTDFKPVVLGIPSDTYDGRPYPIICEGGNTYEYSTNEAVISKPTLLPYTYSQNAFIYTKGEGEYNFLCWDKDINALCQVNNGYDPYYFGATYLMSRKPIEEDERNNPLNGHEFLKMVLIEQHDSLKTTPEVLVVTKNTDGKVYRTILSVEFWEAINGKNELVSGTKEIGGEQLPISENTPCVANKRYDSMLFANGNKVCLWYYGAKTIKVNNIQTIGSESAIITALALSADQKQTYVAFYEPEQTGLNGSVWVIDTDKGTILNTYDKVCYQPVKIIYKKK